MTEELSGRRIVVPETRELRRAKPRCEEDACRGSFALSGQSDSGSALGQSSVCNFSELCPIYRAVLVIPLVEAHITITGTPDLGR